jgi:hypothetical protein
MSTLEELKKAAESAKGQSKSDELQREERIAEFRQKIRPKMNEVFRYFKEVVDTLNVLEQETKRDIFFEGSGELAGLVQGSYFITSSPDDSYSEVSIGFRCEGKRPHILTLKTPLSLEHQKEFLFKHEIKFRLTEKRDHRGDLVSARVEISPSIPCSLRFRTNPEAERVELTLRNLGKVGERRIKLKPGYLKDSFYDEVVKFILNKPSKFDVKEKLDMDDDTRRRLQDRLQAAKQQKPPEPVTDKKPKGLFGSLFKK